jgi:hypothetical protein
MIYVDESYYEIYFVDIHHGYKRELSIEIMTYISHRIASKHE